jgi:Anti-sigma-K factor rskA/Putative zinc-finger
MTDDGIHGLSGAYVVDAVDDVERARFEAHMAHCSQCRDEVASLRAAASELTSITFAAPAPSLRASVLRDIRSVRPLPPRVTPGQEDPAPTIAAPVAAPSASDASSDASAPPASLESKRAENSRGAPLRRWIVGAAAAAVLATGGLVWHPWSPDSRSVQLTATQQVLQAKDAQHFEAKIGNATATVVRSISLKKAIIVTADMPATPAGKAYELWLKQGSALVKAGLMPTGPSNTVLIQGDAATATGVGITVEPAAGSDTPTLPPVALIPFT